MPFVIVLDLKNKKKMNIYFIEVPNHFGKPAGVNKSAYQILLRKIKSDQTNMRSKIIK